MISKLLCTGGLALAFMASGSVCAGTDERVYRRAGLECGEILDWAPLPKGPLRRDRERYWVYEKAQLGRILKLADEIIRRILAEMVSLGIDVESDLGESVNPFEWSKGLTIEFRNGLPQSLRTPLGSLPIIGRFVSADVSQRAALGRWIYSTFASLPRAPVDLAGVGRRSYSNGLAELWMEAELHYLILSSENRRFPDLAPAVVYRLPETARAANVLTGDFGGDYSDFRRAMALWNELRPRGRHP